MKSIRYFFDSLRWVKALFSPFTPIKLKLYVGKTKIGTPYFFPRKWVKYTHEDAVKAVEEHLADSRKAVASYERLYDMYRSYTKAVPIKMGFDYCELGWKTKWDQYDIRHEYNPIYTFVFFGYQIAIIIYHEHQSHFWEPWICYEYCSDKKLSKRERIAFCRKKCPQTWSRLHKDGTSETTDYWNLILKSKYL